MRFPFFSTRDLRQCDRRWVHWGWLPVIGALALSLTGVEAISTTEADYAARQMTFLPLGLFAAAGVAALNPRWMERYAFWLAVAAVLLLLVVLMPGVPESIVRSRKGARRWISLVITDFQPSELAKIAVILALATWLRTRSDVRMLRGLVVPSIIAFVPFVLILVEPDLGTALTLVPVTAAMLLVAGCKRRHLAGVALALALLAVVSVPFLKGHQRDRVDALIAQIQGSTKYSRSIGFQADRAMTLVGAGGVLGRGEEAAKNLVEQNALPEEHNDMIFASVACRWGWQGSVAILLGAASVSIGALIVAGTVRDPGGRLIAVGIGTLLMTQYFVNIGMNVGILPIAGITLPFVSSGGTSLISSWFMIGMLWSIASMRRGDTLRPAFEIQR
ncbi:MAG: FtsW/RodA/SpoVE family cell cycle protein [Planctomycetota bacterium]|nr:FtsW/RodA/SpoVE family cell cycle protein [Planctomycetota bacterium]